MVRQIQTERMLKRQVLVLATMEMMTKQFMEMEETEQHHRQTL
jgi:hypothetical protein